MLSDDTCAIALAWSYESLAGRQLRNANPPPHATGLFQSCCAPSPVRTYCKVHDRHNKVHDAKVRCETRTPDSVVRKITAFVYCDPFRRLNSQYAQLRLFNNAVGLRCFFRSCFLKKHKLTRSFADRVLRCDIFLYYSPLLSCCIIQRNCLYYNGNNHYNMPCYEHPSQCVLTLATLLGHIHLQQQCVKHAKIYY